MQTAFVTGGAGFLGRHVIERLRARGVRVIAFVRRAPPLWMSQSDVIVARGELSCVSQLKDAMPDRVDAVFHIAGNTSSWRGHAAELKRDNVDATRAVVEVALARGARRLVHTSTAGVFAFHEAPFNESAELRGASTGAPYLVTKAQAEEEVMRGVEQGLSAVIMNPGHIVGRYDEHGWGSLFHQAGSGALDRAPPGRASFCDARAIADAHITAIHRGNAGQRYLLGGADASYLEFFTEIAKRAGVRPPRGTVPAPVLRFVGRFGEALSALAQKPPKVTGGLAALLTRDLVFSSDRAVRDLGYAPASLAEMLDDLAEWWKAHHAPTSQRAEPSESRLRIALPVGAAQGAPARSR